MSIRRIVPGFLVCAALSAPVYAAPTCQNINGETVRCGTADAMPVGWRAPERQLAPQNSMAQILGAFCALAVFFSLLALMPDFDGSAPGAWDREEDDERRR